MTVGDVRPADGENFEAINKKGVRCRDHASQRIETYEYDFINRQRIHR